MNNNYGGNQNGYGANIMEGMMGGSMGGYGGSPGGGSMGIGGFGDYRSGSRVRYGR